MRNLLFLWILAAAWGISARAFAQTSEFKRWSLQGGIYHHKGIWGFGWYPQLAGGFVGAEYDWKRTEKRRFYQSLRLCYDKHKYWDQNLSLFADVGYEWFLYKGLHVGGRIGLGGSVWRKDRYYQIYEDGQWVEKHDDSPVSFRFGINTTLRLGYTMRWGTIFLNYGYTVVAPFLRFPQYNSNPNVSNVDEGLGTATGIPFILYHEPTLGVRIPIGK